MIGVATRYEPNELQNHLMQVSIIQGRLLELMKVSDDPIIGAIYAHWQTEDPFTHENQLKIVREVMRPGGMTGELERLDEQLAKADAIASSARTRKDPP